MIRILSVDNMRKSDAAAIAEGTPGRELMLRAGQRIFESVAWKPPVGILCGSGNNAGDGYVIAKLLRDAGIACDMILLSEKFSEDGVYYYNLCREAGIPSLLWNPAIDLTKYKTIADCLLAPVSGARSGAPPGKRSKLSTKAALTWSPWISTAA